MKSIDRIDFNKSAFYNDAPDYLGCKFISFNDR
jgi:hypothetical protein